MTTDNPTFTERIAAREAELTAKRDAVPADDQLRATQAELAAQQQQRRDLTRRLAALRSAVTAVEALASGEADERWYADLTRWRATICDELLALPKRIRDTHTLGILQNLTFSLRAIDFGLHILGDSGRDLTNLRLGELMRDAGYEVTGADPTRNYAGELQWFGSLPEVERRIANLERRRAQAQSALDDALLSDEERAKKEAEAKARRDALNALPVRKVREDGSQYDKYPDGRRVEVTDGGER